MHHTVRTSCVKTRNSLGGDTHILLASGFYKKITKISKFDTVVGEHGHLVPIEDVTYKGKRPVISLYNEAWSTSTLMTAEQHYVANRTTRRLVLPNKLDVHNGHDLDWTQEQGYVYGFIMTAGHPMSNKDNDKTILFLHNDKKRIIRTLNRHMCSVLGIQNVHHMDGKYLTHYIIDNDCLPLDIKEVISTDTYSPRLISHNESFMTGVANGIQDALRSMERLDTRDRNMYQMYCNIVNLMGIANKKPRYYIERKNEIIDVYDIHVLGHDFIGNNIVFSDI
jgi:hypothetical protein